MRVYSAGPPGINQQGQARVRLGHRHATSLSQARVRLGHRHATSLSQASVRLGHRHAITMSRLHPNGITIHCGCWKWAHMRWAQAWWVEALTLMHIFPWPGYCLHALHPDPDTLLLPACRTPRPCYRLLLPAGPMYDACSSAVSPEEWSPPTTPRP